MRVRTALVTLATAGVLFASACSGGSSGANQDEEATSAPGTSQCTAGQAEAVAEAFDSDELQHAERFSTASDPLRSCTYAEQVLESTEEGVTNWPGFSVEVLVQDLGSVQAAKDLINDVTVPDGCTIDDCSNENRFFELTHDESYVVREVVGADPAQLPGVTYNVSVRDGQLNCLVHVEIRPDQDPAEYAATQDTAKSLAEDFCAEFV